MRDGPDRKKAREVVHRLGTNDWPVLVEWLRREDHPTAKGRFYSFRSAMREWMVKVKFVKPHPETAYFDAKESYRALGMLALQELGPDGKATIPALIRLLAEKRPKPDEISPVAGAAFCILPTMSPESIGPLTQALSSPSKQVRQLAASALSRIGTNANAAIPILEVWLHDEQLSKRLQAAYVLGKIGGNPRECVSVVITSLSEGNMEALNYQLDILKEFKGRAKPAIPILLGILTNTPESKTVSKAAIRNSVMVALHEIDSEAVVKAGLQ
jgi:HEAT repeat protein